MVALNADTGKLAWYHQEIPHDDWDYDSALGESVLLDVPVDGKMRKLAVHQNKSGFVFVSDRTDGKIVNAAVPASPCRLGPSASRCACRCGGALSVDSSWVVSLFSCWRSPRTVKSNSG